MAMPSANAKMLMSVAFLLVAMEVRICVFAEMGIGYYGESCPRAESIVRSTLAENMLLDPAAPAAMLRLVFHDCQVGGCDASILLKTSGSITSELASDKNFGIRRLDLIDLMKSRLESACPGVVSCADIVVLAARDGISLTGGPSIPVPTGRRDTTFASNSNADAHLPTAAIGLAEFFGIFSSKGMSPEESVAILGAHTLGVGHCVNIVNRLYPARDATLGFLFGEQLTITCPTSNPSFINNFSFVPNDFTNLFFDNRYFRDLRIGRAVFTLDSEVATSPATSAIVATFAQNQNLFFSSFQSAFVKLTASNVLTGDQGEVRRRCGYVN